MKLELGFGQGTQPLEIPDRNVMGVLEPNPVPAGLTGTAEVARALALSAACRTLARSIFASRAASRFWL